MGPRPSEPHRRRSQEQGRGEQRRAHIRLAVSFQEVVRPKTCSQASGIRPPPRGRGGRHNRGSLVGYGLTIEAGPMIRAMQLWRRDRSQWPWADDRMNHLIAIIAALVVSLALVAGARAD